MVSMVWSAEGETASTVRSSVRTQSQTEQVAQPSADEAVRSHPSPEQSGPAVLIRSTIL